MPHTHRFIIATMLASGGIALLAAQLLGSQPAQGQPFGPNVSYGANPIFSLGGRVTQNNTETLFTAPSDQDMVVTDVVLTTRTTKATCIASIDAIFADSTDTLAMFTLGSMTDTTWSNGGSQLVANLRSGIRVAAGESLTLNADLAYANSDDAYNCGALAISYTLSGYYAAP